ATACYKTQRLKPLDHLWHKWDRQRLAGFGAMARQPPDGSRLDGPLEVELIPCRLEKLAFANPKRQKQLDCPVVLAPQAGRLAKRLEQIFQLGAAQGTSALTFGTAASD